jgi:uncharacterized SAM-binding protein YcdF (DUF218 family)
MSASGSFPQATRPAPIVKGNKSRKATVVVLLLLAALPIAWHFRVPLLTSLARAWEVNEPPQSSDAIVVLGGGLNTRPFEAVRLFNQHLAPRILIAETQPSPVSELGVAPRETDYSRAVLMKLGVPDEAITTFGHNVTSTFDEASALRDWLIAHHATRVIIPTDFSHTRRVAWLMKHSLPPGTKVYTVSTPSLTYDQTNWWQREDGVIAMQNEVIKNIFYRLKY